MTEQTAALYDKLLAMKGEDDIRSRLRELLSTIKKGDYNLEYFTGNGHADMVCHEYKVIIETKARGECGPLLPGSKPEETQQDQVKRYLSALAAPRLWDDHNDSELTGWRGFLTDGASWWGWEYDYAADALQQIDLRGNGRPNTITQFVRFASEYLAPEMRKGIPAPPDPLLPLFRGPLDRLQEIQQEVEGQPFYDTKFAMWRDILQGSGLISDSPLRMASNFAQHTILVIASRIIVAATKNGTFSKQSVLLTLEEGFCGWPLECRAGRAVISNLIDTIIEYNWQAAGRDLLKGLYHDLISQEDRKEFGEYYTPDWLAESLVQQVLDSDTMDEIIDLARKRIDSNTEPSETGSHIVLDPSCGSGTFLYHSARAIVARINTQYPHLIPQCRQIVAAIVQGFDIHPIAVEMSKATLSTALPPATNQDEPEVTLRCFVSDSLHTAHKAQLTISGGLDLEAPNGRTLHISGELLTSPFAHQRISTLVDEAIARAERPVSDKVAPDVAALAEAIKEMGDHVWKWYISNQVEPARLAEHKARVIIGNPPWLVMNDTEDGARKSSIADLRKSYRLKPTVRSSAQGDLAAVFSARTVDLFLADNGNFGFVLPGSALISQTWEKWRNGSWGLATISFDMARNLDNLKPPVFDGSSRRSWDQGDLGVHH